MLWAGHQWSSPSSLQAGSHSPSSLSPLAWPLSHHVVVFIVMAQPACSPAAAAASFPPSLTALLLSPAPPLCVVGWPSMAPPHHCHRLVVTPHCRCHHWCGLCCPATLLQALSTAPCCCCCVVTTIPHCAVIVTGPSPPCCGLAIDGPSPLSLQAGGHSILDCFGRSWAHCEARTCGYTGKTHHGYRSRSGAQHLQVYLCSALMMGSELWPKWCCFTIFIISHSILDRFGCSWAHCEASR